MVKIQRSEVIDAVMDVIPKIKELTGWDVPLERINIYAITRDQKFEYSDYPFFKSLNLDVKETERKDDLYQGLYIPLISNILILEDRKNLKRKRRLADILTNPF